LECIIETLPRNIRAGHTESLILQVKPHKRSSEVEGF